MNSLPQSIETALAEAEFSSTEILILKRLLEDDALTIRQMAAKTGKSTGLLDQAMKKLLRKEITAKEWINDGYKYTLVSLDAVAHWMGEDLRRKHELMLRKHQNFETFIANLKIDKQRPEFHYYDGLDGLAQAYRELLKNKGELLSFIPVFCSAEDDPLRDFRVEYFRERRRKGVFQRVIAHNTPLGRRFQSRDPFEYRQTVLVNEEHFAFTFEKAVIGDYVACFNHNEKRACLMKYPELAAMERGVFEGIWREASKKDVPPDAAIVQGAVSAAPVAVLPPMPVPLSTRTLSQLREFFISKKSIGMFAGFAVIAGLLTYGLYWNNYTINVKRLQERALSIARNSVQEIDPILVEQIHVKEDQALPAFAELHETLTSIKNRNPGAAHVYILRHRPDRSADDWEFVVDSDPQTPGIPGESLVVEGSKPALADTAVPEAGTDPIELHQPISFEPFTDKWGTWITGNAPIRNGNGQTVAIIGIDVEAAQADRLSLDATSLAISFVGLFLVFILIRLTAFNRSLFTEIGTLINAKKVLKTLPISMGLALLLSIGMYFFTSHLQMERMRDKLQSIAITAALQISAKDLDALHVKDDWLKPEWNKVVSQLEEIRFKNGGITFAYIIRKTQNPDILEFVADSHSRDPFANTDSDPNNDIDADGDGKIDPQEHDLLQWPGQEYPPPNKEVLDAYNGPVTTEKFYTDTWGKYLSGYSPIYNFQGEAVAVIAVDMNAARLQELVDEAMNPVLYFVAFFLLFFFVQIVVLNKKLAGFAWKALRMRKILVTTALCLEVAYFITLGLYFHNLYLVKQQIGERLMAIAATAAPNFDSRNLDQLRKAADMEKPEYQKVFQQLNTIRKDNSGIAYAYILRATDQKNILEFIADADSNFGLPAYVDTNMDGKLDSSDENVWPGKSQDDIDGFVGASFDKPSYSIDAYEDQWGVWLSGFAPIKNHDGEKIAVLGLDADLSDAYKSVNARFLGWFWFLGITLLLLIISLARNWIR